MTTTTAMSLWKQGEACVKSTCFACLSSYLIMADNYIYCIIFGWWFQIFSSLGKSSNLTSIFSHIFHPTPWKINNLKISQLTRKLFGNPHFWGYNPTSKPPFLGFHIYYLATSFSGQSPGFIRWHASSFIFFAEKVYHRKAWWHKYLHIYRDNMIYVFVSIQIYVYITYITLFKAALNKKTRRLCVFIHHLCFKHPFDWNPSLWTIARNRSC